MNLKGRPQISVIRNRILGILSKINSSYGYEIYKYYKELFGRVHIRSIYYNLKKGIEKEEIIILNVSKELGNYSWGNEVEKIYYGLGPFANINLSKKDEDLLNKIKKKNEIKIDWNKEINNIVKQFNQEVLDYEKRYNKLSNQGKKKIKQLLIQKYNKLKEFNKNHLNEENFRLINKIIKYPHTP